MSDELSDEWREWMAPQNKRGRTGCLNLHWLRVYWWAGVFGSCGVTFDVSKRAQ